MIKSIDTPELGEFFVKSEIPEEFFTIKLTEGEDYLEVYVHQTVTHNGGFKFFASTDFVWAEDSPKVTNIKIYSEGWAAFDGLRHITTYWNYINWKLAERYYKLMQSLEENFVSDFCGERLTEEQFEARIVLHGFRKVGETNTNE